MVEAAEISNNCFLYHVENGREDGYKSKQADYSMLRYKRYPLEIKDEESLEDSVEGDHGEKGNSSKSHEIVMENDDNNGEGTEQDSEYDNKIQKNCQR